MNTQPESEFRPPLEAGPAPHRAPVAPVGAAALANDPRSKQVVLACLLSLCPGLGQVYVGYYQRGFAHAAIVAGIIALLAEGNPPDVFYPLLGVFLPFFWLYNVIDAGRRAAFYNHALLGMTDSFEMPRDISIPGGGSIAGGLVLVTLGGLLLLHTRWGISLSFLEDWWPVAPILLGLYLIGRAVSERRHTG